MQGQEIHGAIYHEKDRWEPMEWDKKGKFLSNQSESGWDLMPDTEYFYCVAFVLLNGDVFTSIFDSEKERADFASNLAREFKTYELEKI